jgi:hypothetical protein
MPGKNIVRALAKLCTSPLEGFISRGDRSGSQTAERRGWKACGIGAPQAKMAHDEECGCGMASALKLSSEAGALLMAALAACATSGTRRRRAFGLRSGLLASACCLLAGATGAVQAEDEVPPKAPSPWILLPTFSNSPKLGTSAGALGAYMKKFDAQSQVSMFGTNAQYTSTDSATVGAFVRASFGADHHRILLIGAGGVIKNDYDDFLGTGVPLKSEDHLRAFVGRYLYRVIDDWFIGVQALSTNYQIVGQTELDEDVLSILGLTGFKAGGIGVSLYHDSRDLQDAPKSGWLFNLNNVAYRKGIEGSNDFDVYRADYRHFWRHGDGHVLALRQSNQWTVNAPPSAYAPVTLRGYTTGEYLGKNMSSIEVEERHRMAERWTATLFGGLACLYGANRKCSDSANAFPSVGIGAQYILKPAQGIVANLECALGKDGNRALLFKMGYGW